MELVTNRIYSFDSIVRGLQNRKDKVKDNAKYPILNEQKFEDVIKHDTLADKVVYNEDRKTAEEVSINGEKAMFDVEVIK